MSLKQLQSSTIRIEPSNRLYHFIANINPQIGNIPDGILAIRENRKPNNDIFDNVESVDCLIVNNGDREYISSLNLPEINEKCDIKAKYAPKASIKHPLTVSDIRWLREYTQNANESGENRVYLHELFEGSEIVVPENERQPRDAVLERRCARLRAQQENMQYNAMTKHIDAVRKRHPEDTIAYQVREMDKYLIVVVQFLMSVAAGFAFGFLGVPLLMYGSVEFGFRLLMGIISALVIAIAELYFVLRKMDRDAKMEEALKEKAKKAV